MLIQVAKLNRVLLRSGTLMLLLRLAHLIIAVSEYPRFQKEVEVVRISADKSAL